MNKKIILFFVLLLGMSSSLWADDATFGYSSGVSLSSISVKNGASQPLTSGNITLTFTSTSEKTIGQNGEQLKFQQGTSFTVSASNAIVTKVVINQTETGRSFTANTGNYSHTSGTGTWTSTGSSTSDITFTNGNSDNLNVTSIVVTYETIDENTYTAPKTWTFNKGGDSWTDISGSDLTDNGLWVSQTVNGNVYYEYNGTASGDVPLYYKDGVKLIPEAQGLLFNANGTASNITTDLKYDITIKNGASVIIPNSKAGQLITLYGWYGSSSLTMSDNVTQESSDVPTDGGAGTIKIRVNSDGDVRLSHNYLNIWSISIYGDLTRFSSMGGQTYVHEAGAAPFNHTIIVEPTDALPANMDSSTLKNYITVTSSNSDAFNVDNITLSYNQAKGRLIIYGIQPGTTNGQEATLTISYHDRPYNATSITTRPFYIRQAATVSFAESSITIDFDETNPAYQTASSSYNGTIKYKTSSSIIDVDENTGEITAIHGTGAVVITAYTEQTDEYAYAEASYTLNITAEGDVAFYFLRDETKVNIGYSAYLELAMPGVKQDKINDLYFIIKDPDGVDHKVVAFSNTGQTPSEDEFSNSVTTEVEKNVDGQVIRAMIKILADDNELAVGRSLIVTAYLDYKYTPAGTSDEVRALASSVTKLTFTGATARNWDLVRNGGYMFVGDVIGVPGIWGNPNANEGDEYALAVNTNRQYLQNGVGTSKTVYRPKSNTVTYTLLKVDSNEPEDLVTLFHCQNLEKLGNDSLLVYARAAGSVKIRLTDNTTGSYSDYSLLIKTRDDVVSRSASQIEHFPYTWDFSQGVSTDSKGLLASDENYWSRYDHPDNKTMKALKEGVYTTNMGFARRDISQSSGNLSNKNFTANDQLLIEFRGIQCQIGASDISSTFGRLTIDTNAAVGEPFLHIVGSSKLYLTELNNADKCVDGDYMIYVKAKKGGTGKIECAGTTKYLSGNDPEVLGFEVTQGTQDVMIDADGCYIYWIAATTEARNIGTASGTDGSEANQHLATYSYNADFDLDKVYEAEKVDAWYVTAVGASKAEGSNKKQLGVTLSKVSSEIRANTGMILRQTDNTFNTSTSAYMIAKAKNLSDSYTPPAQLSGNMLKATGMSGTTIYAEAGDADGLSSGNQYLTYIMTSQYVWGKDPDTEINYEGYGFFKLWEDSYAAKPQMSYLVVDKSVFDDVQLGGGVDPADGGAVKLYLVFGDEDEWTSIEDVRTNSKAVEGDEGYYTLQGTRVAQPTKGGIYIHQGKKIFVK